LGDCAPIYTNKDAERTLAADGVTKLDENAAAYPCGLVAKSFFNDTFELYKKENSFADEDRIAIDSNDIAWKSDRENKFFNLGGK